ncbi:MAG TPA: hypothetical protein VFU54_20335 [Actinomycetota bacterium]|nr:hypothetical protein [Actinomycetota bacterium]
MDRRQPDATPTTRTGLPDAVIGAGPVGLAAAQVQLELPASGVCSSNVTFDPSLTRSDAPAAACG